MKPVLLLASALTLLGVTMTSCVHPQPGVAKAPTPPTCGFSDPETSASLGICSLAAEYYLAHGAWPTTGGQLAVENPSLLESGQGDTSDDQAVEISSFLSRFELLELHQKDKNLVIRFRYKLDDKVVEQKVMLRPKATVDEILQSATELN